MCTFPTIMYIKKCNDRDSSPQVNEKKETDTFSI